MDIWPTSLPVSSRIESSRKSVEIFLVLCTLSICTSYQRSPHWQKFSGQWYNLQSLLFLIGMIRRPDENSAAHPKCLVKTRLTSCVFIPSSLFMHQNRMQFLNLLGCLHWEQISPRVEFHLALARGEGVGWHLYLVGEANPWKSKTELIKRSQ